MAAAMAWQKRYFTIGQLAGQELVGSRPERRFYRAPFLVFEAVNIVQAAATDDADALREWRHGFFVASGMDLGLG